MWGLDRFLKSGSLNTKLHQGDCRRLSMEQQNEDSRGSKDLQNLLTGTGVSATSWALKPPGEEAPLRLSPQLFCAFWMEGEPRRDRLLSKHRPLRLHLLWEDFPSSVRPRREGGSCAGLQQPPLVQHGFGFPFSAHRQAYRGPTVSTAAAGAWISLVARFRSRVLGRKHPSRPGV